jgi:hypothetical protein
VDDLRAIARRTGGAYYSANDPSGLLKVLEESLGLSRYVVEGTDGTRSEPHDLGAPTFVELPAAGNGSYRASIVGSDPPVRSDDFVLAGDEALELFLSADKRRLEHRRYTGGAEQDLRDSQTELDDPSQQSRRFFIGAHLPEWQGGGVRFPISVQNADETRFSPRPEVAWVEIKPLAPDRRQDFPAYVFCDRNFEPRRPVPVLSCLATHWPREATKAEIRVWCKFQGVEPDRVVPLAKVAPAGSRDESEFKIPGLADTSFKVRIESGAMAADGQGIPNGQRIVVTEMHPPGAGNLYNFKVALDPSPDGTVRTYYPQAGLARHEFSYSAERGSVWTRAKLQFTARSRLLEQAVTLVKPLTAPIPDPLLRN